MVLPASSTEIESGYVQVISTGTISEDIGFRPDYVEFITAQQIESADFEENVATNSNCPQNVNGWSEGSVIFDSNGVQKQFSIGAFRNSDSTNSHRVASSTSHVIKNVYTGRNGGECGELRISVTQPLSTGFELDVESKYGQYDEIVRYKAYQFPDNMEFEAGMVKISSTGSKNVDTGFQPANIHIRAAQRINGKNVERSFDPNDPEDDNTIGRSKGYATLNSSGSVIDQQSIGTASSSDSTNAHRSIASDEYVLNTAYVGQDGDLFGRLRAKITGADSNSFSIQVDDKWSGTDEVFLYRAWGFSYYEFNIGHKVFPSNFVNWASDEPNDADDGEDCAVTNWDSNGNWNDLSCDDTEPGICEYQDGTYDSTSSMTYSNAKSECESRGGHLAVIENQSENDYVENNFGTGWIGYFQLSSGSEPDKGWRWINPGYHKFNTGFKPDAIDIYAEQQIESINNEVVTPTNSGCENAGGWSNGFYETDDDRQWSISMGRTSDSQDSHRQGASTVWALNNIYSGPDGGDCGNFEASVEGVSNSGFDMDFSFDSNFESNYGEEMVYYRAFDFKLAPPTVESIEFFNNSGQHSFKVVANISEGSNDIDSCDVEAEDNDGNLKTYSGTASKLNETWSQCTYDSIRYNDTAAWEDRHDSDGKLLKLNVTVTAKDVDGQSDSMMDTNTFSETEPVINSLSYSDYTAEHAFNVSAEVSDDDAVNPNEIKSCTFTFSDDDGNSVTESGTIDYSFGDQDQAECRYSNVNRSMPSGVSPGFEVYEQIDIQAVLNDTHDKQDSTAGAHEIPNSLPTAFDPDPEDDAIIGGDPDQEIYVGTETTDPENDPLTVYYYTGEDDLLGKFDASSGDRTSVLYPDTEVGETYEWYVKVDDTYENYTSSMFSFTKTTKSSYRTEQGVEYRYSSVIMDQTGTREVFFEVENNIEEPKQLKTFISGVNARFTENQKSSISYTLDPESDRRFVILIEPNSIGEKTLNLTTENQKLGVNTTTSIPVTVKKYSDVSETAEVPGIGTIQLLMLLLVSAYLYSARL